MTELWDVSTHLHTDLLAHKIRKGSVFNMIQLIMMKTEWAENGFKHIELRDKIRRRLELLLSKYGLSFVPNTVDKSRPSLYVCTNIPPHSDTEVSDTEGIIIPLVSKGYIFRHNWTDYTLHEGKLYRFDHSKSHALMLRSYEDWLALWWLPFVCLTWSIKKQH